VKLGAAWRKRQYRIEPVERLNRRLFIQYLQTFESLCLSSSPIAFRIVFIQASALPSSITNSIEIFRNGIILSLLAIEEDFLLSPAFF
jgi:hypothetical protein